MRHLLRDTAFTTALATGLALVGVAASPVPAQAEPTRLYPASALVLAVAKGESPAATIDRAVTLSCAPTPSGTHPAPETACEELNAVDGDFGQLARMNHSTPCTHVWDPVTVTGEGVWKGKRVSWSATYGNTCAMNAGMARNTVFGF
ncbi:subtilase-type protease inhibitor [Streptomyces sp. P9(2023)]|uniref:subtilase-type protease inhibitor n=1 Tax=Streptomyces sp. P9(2023) TaxID=3064394 RepID=UPI0028F422DF|nr:subtilase-type protease inhibitor [Streptomyces sp. P9(2023)]MDT9690513.1 subtilase-type protease inhibitor [Streptomyces sp. P9(2023)]